MSTESPFLELRRYKLRDGAREYFDRRSREITFPLFQKFGFRVERFWAAVDDPLMIYYAIAWSSVDEMQQKRSAFEADPLWRQMVEHPDYESPVEHSQSVLLSSVLDFTMVPGDGDNGITPGQRLIGEFMPKFASLTDDLVMGDIWSRAELSARDRSLITVAALIVGGTFDPLDGHLARAKRNGLTEDELKEAIMHIAFYAGWPKALAAIGVAKRAFGGEGND